MSNCWSVSAQAQQKLVFQCIRIELNWAVEEESEIFRGWWWWWWIISFWTYFQRLGIVVFFLKNKSMMFWNATSERTNICWCSLVMFTGIFFSLIKDQFSKGKNCCIKMHNDLYSYISLNLIPFEGGKKWRERRNVSFF